MKKLVIEAYIGIDDDVAEDKISDLLQPLIEKFSGCFSDIEGIECFGFAARDNSKGDQTSQLLYDNIPADNYICFMESKDIDNSFRDKLFVESYSYYVIRIPIEGDESHERRFDIMDEVILKSGFSLEDEKKNIFFVFDSGKCSEFKNIAVSLLFANDDAAKNYAATHGISFCQWLRKSDRMSVLDGMKNA